MDKAQQMAGFALHLHKAAATQDWQALGQIDHALATWIAQPAQSSALSPVERAALKELQRAHQQARLQCAAAGDELAQRLSELRANKDGWLAYALNSDMNEAKL